MIAALIFDYFGVIRPQGHGLRSVYRSFGGDVVKDEIFIADLTAAAGYGFITDMDQQFADRLGISVDVWRDAVAQADNNDAALLADIVLLRKQGFRTGLLTNAGAGSLEVFFRNCDIHQYFDVALASGDSGFVKPEAAFYAMMAHRLDVAPENCIMIDDRPEFCKGAEYIGMKSIVYKDFAHYKKDLELFLAP